MGIKNDKNYRDGFGTALFGYRRSDVNKYIADTDREYAEKAEAAERQIEELKLRIAMLEKNGIFGEKKKAAKAAAGDRDTEGTAEQADTASFPDTVTETAAGECKDTDDTAEDCCGDEIPAESSEAAAEVGNI